MGYRNDPYCGIQFSIEDDIGETTDKAMTKRRVLVSSTTSGILLDATYDCFDCVLKIEAQSRKLLFVVFNSLFELVPG
jgi:hypothetical protein